VQAGAPRALAATADRPNSQVGDPFAG